MSLKKFTWFLRTHLGTRDSHKFLLTALYSDLCLFEIICDYSRLFVIICLFRIQHKRTVLQTNMKGKPPNYKAQEV